MVPQSFKLVNVNLSKWSVSCKKEWGEEQQRQKTGFPTCTKSIIAGVHFSEVSVDGGALSRVVGAVQTAMTDRVKITAIWGEIKKKTRSLKQRDPRRKPRSKWSKISKIQEIYTEVHQGSEAKPEWPLCCVLLGENKNPFILLNYHRRNPGRSRKKTLLLDHERSRRETSAPTGLTHLHFSSIRSSGTEKDALLSVY